MKKIPQFENFYVVSKLQYCAFFRKTHNIFINFTTWLPMKINITCHFPENKIVLNPLDSIFSSMKILKKKFRFFIFILQRKIKGKNYFMCYYSETHFFGFCCLFLKYFVKINDAFQWIISREKLVLFQKSTIRTLYDSRKYLNENPQKHDFFSSSFLKFWKKITIFYFLLKWYIERYHLF